MLAKAAFVNASLFVVNIQCVLVYKREVVFSVCVSVFFLVCVSDSLSVYMCTHLCIRACVGMNVSINKGERESRRVSERKRVCVCVHLYLCVRV